MASVNRVTIIGNLGQDPEVRYAPSGTAFCTISVATTDTWKDKQTGKKKEATEWHRISFNDKLAEIVGQYLKKGRPIYVEGSLRTRKWTNKEGVEQYTTEIRADRMQMLGSREGSDGDQPPRQNDASTSQRRDAGQSRSATAQTSATQGGGFGDFDDDIPFSNPYRRHLSLLF